MKFHLTGVGDFKNKALISVSKSKKTGDVYYGVEIKDPEDGLVDLDVKMGYNYFQYLGPNKTRHVAIWNTNPNIDYVPAVVLNFMMTNVLYT